MFIGNQEIETQKNIEDDLIEVKFKDDPNPVCYHKEVFKKIISKKPNKDDQDVRVKRTLPVVSEILKILSKYNIFDSDRSFIFDRVEDAQLRNKNLAYAKQSNIDIPKDFLDSPEVIVYRKRGIEDAKKFGIKVTEQDNYKQVMQNKLTVKHIKDIIG